MVHFLSTRPCIHIQGECFGLLGINGAGKTTTFKMLTGDISASSGDAYLSGHSVTWSLKDAQTKFGYCPQFDALIDQLTVRETMYMYARLRGIAESSIAATVDNIISMSMLHKHRSKQAGKLRSDVFELMRRLVVRVLPFSISAASVRRFVERFVRSRFPHRFSISSSLKRGRNFSRRSSVMRGIIVG